MNYDNIKKLRSSVNDILKIENEIKLTLESLYSIRTKIQTLINSNLTKYEDSINDLEKYFGISEKENKEMIPDQITFTIAKNVNIRAKLFKNIEEIPIMSYGAIRKNGNIFLIYKYSNKYYINCSECEVSFTSNIHSMLCNNIDTCKFGNNCKYYHDPFLFNTSNHIQRFPASQLIKKHPTFGNSTEFKDQMQDLQFDDMYNFARYVCIMNLLINVALSKK